MSFQGIPASTVGAAGFNFDSAVVTSPTTNTTETPTKIRIFRFLPAMLRGLSTAIPRYFPGASPVPTPYPHKSLDCPHLKRLLLFWPGGNAQERDETVRFRTVPPLVRWLQVQNVSDELWRGRATEAHDRRVVQSARGFWRAFSGGKAQPKPSARFCLFFRSASCHAKKAATGLVAVSGTDGRILAVEGGRVCVPSGVSASGRCYRQLR